MIQQILLALLLVALTVIIHAVGTVRVVLPICGLWKKGLRSKASLRPVTSLIVLVSGLLILHLVAMAAWAATFTLFGVLPDFETSFYYSIMSYTTVGYGDVGPVTSWRLLGPIEAAVGVLMLGLSTGVIVAVVQRLYANRPTDVSEPPTQAT